jgi:hypothetical protein
MMMSAKSGLAFAGKKPVFVYAALALLLLQLFVVTRIAVRAADPNGYLLGGYRAVVAGVLLTAFFYWKPRIGRWYVVPYLLFLGPGVFSGMGHLEKFSWQLLFNIGVAAIYCWIAILLCRLPRRDASPILAEDP